MMKIAEKLIGICYVAGVGGVGYVLGGLYSTSEAPKVVEDAKTIDELHKMLDEVELIRKMDKRKMNKRD